jgi:hypothetical protein
MKYNAPYFCFNQTNRFSAIFSQLIIPEKTMIEENSQSWQSVNPATAKKNLPDAVMRSMKVKYDHKLSTVVCRRGVAAACDGRSV